MAPKRSLRRVVKDLKVKAAASKEKLLPNLLPPPKVIKVTADFCGYGTAALALSYLGVKFETSMCSEADPDVRELLKITHEYIGKPLGPDQMSCDVRTRPLVESDIYIGTSPCQDYSAAGTNQGSSGSDGFLWYDQCEKIVVERPRAFMLENVSGLLRRHQQDLHVALQIFGEAGYVVLHKLLTTAEHGLPQKRQRLYICGIRRDSLNPNVSLDTLWPKPLEHPVNLRMFLNKERLPGLPVIDEASQCTTFRENLEHAKRIMGDDWRKFGVCIDVGAGQHKICTSECFPTITSSRASALSYYAPYRRQKLSAVELGRLQGLPDDLTEQMETRCGTRVVGAAIGNALSLNVVERVLRNLLWASSLVSELPSDFWQCLGPLPATGAWKRIAEERCKASCSKRPKTKRR